ncbi:MAG: hypothetical protein AAF850_04755, partial [Pseudomonadota bacterium]
MSKSTFEKTVRGLMRAPIGGATAAIGVFAILLGCAPPEDEEAIKTSVPVVDQLHSLCIDSIKKDVSRELNKYEIATCQCLRSVGDRVVADDDPETKITAEWYASTRVLCGRYNPALMEEVAKRNALEKDYTNEELDRIEK